MTEEKGIPNLATNIVCIDTTEDSFSVIRGESIEILEMVPLDSPSDDE